MPASTQQRLAQLDLSADAVVAALPAHLTLSLIDGVLSLCDPQKTQSTLSVSFNQADLLYRAQGHLGGEHVVKACQIRGQKNIKLLDATCGLGIDSYLLHQAGFVVTAVERHPLIHALLKDALVRYENEHQRQLFQLLYQDSKSLMDQEVYDVIYLDPMFPPKRKSAKNKKGMQLFQDLNHSHADEAVEMVEHALKARTKRVVIKRPQKAPTVTKFKPTFQIPGKTCRFDAYQVG
ncbi:class I SAM-dependent methyltransferase [Marinicella sp. S1101]|uniref:class I SAM-dependent methyltransferase n=1 Tax=Marinicella marina TaxID=2996016 RepID=UPI002260BDA5|nr:class I SAM-dependent methyltransferase [Marinicella marina]MCX7552418.1 class I SAM-dependent methyltransferase [Marinicella marina]MDJ1139293.1 class I SAM-dependent methyltransferase [Marinicella marina]